MSAIFISHSSKDSVLAKAIDRRLGEQHHHSVFLDLDPEKGIVGGQSWERTLYRKLRSCRAVISSARTTIMNAGEPVSVGFSRDARLMFALQDEDVRAVPKWLNAKSLVRMWDVETGEQRFAEPFGSAVPTRVVAISPDGQRLLIGSDKRVLVLAVGGALLQSALGAATTACLAPEFRQQNLGESDAEARRAYAACEHKHGRN